jgi:imidazolonepropionase-like amidohydrolase
VRYWERHARPRLLATLPGDPIARVVVEYRGADTLRLGSPERTVPLRRYSVDGVAWGREALWLDETGRFAAIVTRANMLPLEGVREDLASALPTLQSIAIADRMRDLQGLSRQARPVAQGTYALVGARLVDGTGDPPVEDATVVIRDGRIAAAGRRALVPLPPGSRAIDARGKTVIPGLWDMHAHVAAVEWGPAYLGVGVTTARDMGGEQPFLVALRDAVAAGPRRGIGPRLLLAGLVDGGGPEAFGTTSATTPNEGRSVVEAYHAAGFQQIKLYTLLRPDVVGAIIRRAHELKMTVTGHIPRAMTLEQAVDSGIDHVAHLPLRGDAGSAEVQRLIQLLAQRDIVVDPTISWEELLGHAMTTPVSSFQPGFRFAPWPVVAVYRSVRNTGDSATVERSLRGRLAIIEALHEAGVRIVAGTDYGIPGQSLLRELELYVRAGLTPMEAIRAATAVPASVMGLGSDVGTIAAGKRADLLVLDANPLAEIANIRTGHWVVANGVMYDCATLSRSVGFAAPRRLNPSWTSSGRAPRAGPSRG